MNKSTNYRRVVTGLDEQGRSCVTIDGPVPRHDQATNLVWRSHAVPADNSGNADNAIPYTMEMLHDGGSNFMLVELPPGIPSYKHATDTLDYLIVLSGNVILELDTEEVALGPGDFIVDRGVIHAWRNDGPETAVMASITLPALPVGNGRTV